MDPKEIIAKIQQQNRLAPGHRTCAGCAIPIILRTVMAACGHELVVANATSCSEVTTTIYPFTSWNVPWIHNAFENAAATISGVEAAYQALKKRGKMAKEVRFLACGGDGGTYDIGLQALSGALERGQRFVYLCYDNEGYMNTGGQRSSATPPGASTATTPAGQESSGKTQRRKDLMAIVAAHHIPFVAQASVFHWQDLYQKAVKAFAADGPAFLNVFSPCVANWKYPSAMTLEVARLAVETRFWPLYEIENGRYRINYRPSQNLPVTEFIKTQDRFAHLFKPENAAVIQELQTEIETRWRELEELERCFGQK